MNAPQVENQEPAARGGLMGGIMSVVTGVTQIRKSLSRTGWTISAILFVLGGGLVGDRTQGFPLTKKVLAPLLSSSESSQQQIRIERRISRMDSKTDTVLAKIAALEEKVQETQDSIKSVKKAVKKTQLVVDEIAVLTKTREKIKKKQEQDRGLFDWGAL